MKDLNPKPRNIKKHNLALGMGAVFLVALVALTQDIIMTNFLAYRLCQADPTPKTFIKRTVEFPESILLGGGLASLMSVFFDKPALVFDEAPFQLSAINPVLLSSLEASLLINGYTDLDFALYNASFGTLFQFREENVSHIYLDGEILSEYRNGLTTIVGPTETFVDMGNSTLNATDRHAMTLLTAMLGDQSFASVIQQLPDLATYLLDPVWFGVMDRRTPDTIDLLSALIRIQYGAEGVAMDSRLDRFTADMQKLVGTVGTAQDDAPVRDALMIAAMEYYAAKITTSADHFFTVDGNGLHFRYSDIGTNSYKSLPLQASAIDSLLGPDSTITYDQLVTQDAWHIQSGNAGMIWSATGIDDDAFIGGALTDRINAGAGNDVFCGIDGDEILNGEAGNDHLLGGTGNDLLQGGTGNDTLNGGAGNDTYLYHAGDGHDTIVDNDGQGKIVITDANGSVTEIATGDFLRAAPGTDQWTSTSGNISLSHADSWVLTLTDGGTIDLGGDFHSGHFGINLVEAPPPPATTPSGDDTDNFLFTATASNQEIHALGGRDMLFGGSGDDILDGGAGDDWIVGRGGADTIAGGTVNDLITWIAGGTRVYAGAGSDMVAANAREWFYLDHPQGPITADAIWSDVSQHWQLGHDQFREHLLRLADSDSQGVILNGDEGDDLLIGNGAGDTLLGGADQDILMGNGGDDVLEGGEGDDILAGGAGVDLLLGEAGNDEIHGESRADVIFGGAGDDLILGQGGNDMVLGNNGQDLLIGGAGDDMLDGWSDDDFLYGDNHPSELLSEELQGNDQLAGGDGDDVLIYGNDHIRGGKGRRDNHWRMAA